jgi:hypothetical protein
MNNEFRNKKLPWKTASIYSLFVNYEITVGSSNLIWAIMLLLVNSKNVKL